MKYIYLISLCLLISLGSQGQRHCDVNRQIQYVLQNHPESWDTFIGLKDQSQAEYRSEITLPIVVHVVYSQEENNISDFQILSQIEALNEAFTQNRSNSQGILSDHRDVIEIPNFRFQLACRDPNGNSTSGITRTVTQIPNIGFHFDYSGVYALHHTDLGGIDPWPTDQYINIWVAEMESAFLGRSSMPMPLPDPNEDGIVINPDHFGFAGLASTGTPYHLGSTLAHEMGHYLGLLHPWGRGIGSCDEDDGVEDTPNQEVQYYGCPSEETSISCGSNDMTKNIMGYADDDCLLYFTSGQVSRMKSILSNFRTTLTTSNALDNCNISSVRDSSLLIWNRLETGEWIVLFPTIEPTIEMEIYNMSGQLLKASVDRNTELTRINLKTYPTGLYVVRFYYDEKVEQRVLTKLQ